MRLNPIILDVTYIKICEVVLELKRRNKFLGHGALIDAMTEYLDPANNPDFLEFVEEKSREKTDARKKQQKAPVKKKGGKR